MTKRGFQAKTELTPIEKLKCAYFHEVRGIDQHILADLCEVNLGRVNVAIQQIREVIGLKEDRADLDGTDLLGDDDAQ